MLGAMGNTLEQRLGLALEQAGWWTSPYFAINAINAQ